MHQRISSCVLLMIIATFNCLGCDGEVCTSSFCKPNEYCLMKSLSCDNTTCPEAPVCISKEHVCSTSFPYQQANSAVMQCSESLNVCTIGNKCQNGYCCVDVDHPVIDDVSESFDGNTQDGNDFLQEIFGSLDVDNVQECRPCEMQSCDFGVCIYPEPVTCVPDNCSCMVSYEDLNGRPVQCEIPDEGIIPILPDEPGDGLFPIDVPIAKGLDHTNTTDDSVTVRPTEEVVVTTTLKKSMTASPTQKELLTLRTFNNNDRKSTTAFIIVGALGALFVLAIMGYAVYKIYTAKITRKTQKPEDDLSDVKVPLKDMSTHNNNEVKNTEKLLNGHSAGEKP